MSFEEEFKGKDLMEIANYVENIAREYRMKFLTGIIDLTFEQARIISLLVISGLHKEWTEFDMCDSEDMQELIDKKIVENGDMKSYYRINYKVLVENILVK